MWLISGSSGWSADTAWILRGIAKRTERVVVSQLLRRIRDQSDRVPAILYGAGRAPQPITLLHRDILKALENEAIFSSVFEITLDGKSEIVVLKDVQRQSVYHSL